MAGWSGWAIVAASGPVVDGNSFGCNTSIDSWISLINRSMFDVSLGAPRRCLPPPAVDTGGLLRELPLLSSLKPEPALESDSVGV